MSPVDARCWNRTSDCRRGRIVTGAVEVTDTATTRLWVAVVDCLIDRSKAQLHFAEVF
jgi:hypothetical protein